MLEKLIVFQQIWKTQQWPWDWKRSVFIPVLKKVQIIVQLHSFHMLARFSSKSFKLGFSSTWTENFQMYKLDLEKAKEPEIKLPTSVGSLKKQQSSIKTSTFALLIMPNPLTVWITTNCVKVFKGQKYQTTLAASWEICRQVKNRTCNNELVPDWERSTSRLYIVTLLI